MTKRGNAFYHTCSEFELSSLVLINWLGSGHSPIWLTASWKSCPLCTLLSLELADVTVPNSFKPPPSIQMVVYVDIIVLTVFMDIWGRIILDMLWLVACRCIFRLMRHCFLARWTCLINRKRYQHAPNEGVDSYQSYGSQTWPIKWSAVSSRQRSYRYCYMDALLGR